jgi:hypothetical protein
VCRWIYETGGVGVTGKVGRDLLAAVSDQVFDLAWVGGGALVDWRLLQGLRKNCRFLLNYNADNPYLYRDGQLWRQFKKAIPEYDVLIVPRRSNLEEAKAAGAKRVQFEFFAADEQVVFGSERPPGASDAEKSGVVFVGTWMPRRCDFLLRLVDRSVPLKIYGQRWRKSPQYALLRPYIVEGDYWGGAYRKVIASAEIAIGLLSEGNRDLHTTRSVEIPAIGTLFCARRTADHLELYEEGEEAIFWEDADECASQCLQLLADRSRLREISRAGRQRAIQNQNFNEVLVSKIIDNL